MARKEYASKVWRSPKKYQNRYFKTEPYDNRKAGIVNRLRFSENVQIKTSASDEG